MTRPKLVINQITLASIIIAVVLAVSILTTGWLALSAVHRAESTAVSTGQLCRSGNESRAQQVQLWEHLVAISTPPPGQTPAEKRARAAQARAFLAYVHQVFAPRDCRKYD